MTKEQRQWCNSAMRYGGSFVKSFAEMMFYADDDNQRILIPVLRILIEKYPHYSEERMKVEP